jgi:putative SOS response-associated peptidase YedK
VILQEKAENQREMKSLRWGLIPFWAKEESIGNRMINARAESVPSKPTFKRPFARQRCLVLADGFYEWQKTGSVKQPYRITLQSGDLFAFAGLWDRWKKPDGEELQTFTIITTEANDLTRKLHDRMPVILSPEDYETWLDPTFHETDTLQKCLRPYPSNEMTCYPVSRMVNSPKNEDPRCIEPLPE